MCSSCSAGAQRAAWSSSVASFTSSTRSRGSRPEAASACVTVPWRSGADDLAGGQVDRDGERRSVGRFPGPLRGLAARGVEDGGADRDDESGVLGEMEELRGREDAELRVLPAQQRLDPDDLGAGEAHDRLVVDAELAAVDGVAHRVPQRRLVACVGPDCRLDAVVFRAAVGSPAVPSSRSLARPLVMSAAPAADLNAAAGSREGRGARARPVTSRNDLPGMRGAGTRRCAVLP